MKKYAYAQQMNTMAAVPVDASGAIIVKRHRHVREALNNNENEDYAHYAKILESIDTLKV